MVKPPIYDEYLKEQSIPLTNEDIKAIYNYEIHLLDTLKLNFTPNKIIEEAISKDSYGSYKYAENLLEIFKDIKVIPKNIEEAISKDTDYSYNYAVNLLVVFKDIKVIPKIIEEVILQKPLYSYWYTEKLLAIFKDINIIPKIIEEAITKDSESLFKYIKLIKKRIFTNKADVIDRFEIYKKLVASNKKFKVFFNEKDITKLYSTNYDNDMDKIFEFNCFLG